MRRFRKGKGVVELPPTLTLRGLTLPLAVPGGGLQNHFVPSVNLGKAKWKDIETCL